RTPPATPGTASNAPSPATSTATGGNRLFGVGEFAGVTKVAVAQGQCPAHRHRCFVSPPFRRTRRFAAAQRAGLLFLRERSKAPPSGRRRNEVARNVESSKPP